MTPAEVRAWRQAHDLTQDQLAGLLGVRVQTVLRWEAGHTAPPAFLRLALEALDQLYDLVPA